MARDFNGSTDRIDYANPIDLADSALTIAGWVYPDTLDSTDDLFAVLHQAGDAAGAIWVEHAGSRNVGSLQIVRVWSAGGPPHQGKYRHGTGELTMGSWQHVCCTSDSGGLAAGMECYVDGSVPGTSGTLTGGSGSQVAASGKLSLGGLYPADTECFGGRLAEVGVWNRVLSTDEIAALAKGFSPLHFLRGLRFYTKLIGRKDIDIIAGKTPTYDGTAIIEHPGIIYPG